MKALDNLMTALQAAGGRRRAFKMREIPLSERQRDILRDLPKQYNKLALTSIQAYDIIRGRDSVIDCIKVVWVLFGKYGMMNYYTHNEFQNLFNDENKH